MEKTLIQIKTILIDADGTIFFHEYPFIGKEVPHAVRVLKRMESVGHILILHTMRHGDELEHAKAWLLDNDLHFDDFNRNTMFETGSRKIYGHWHIDDHNLGSPLIHDFTIHPKPFVDWLQIEKILEEKELI